MTGSKPETISPQYSANASAQTLRPYSWQLDVTEAIFLGLDPVVIAGTGAGKTMPFMMPLLQQEAGYHYFSIKGATGRPGE